MTLKTQLGGHFLLIISDELKFFKRLSYRTENIAKDFDQIWLRLSNITDPFFDLTE
jgi:hypothetical protein